VVAFGRLLEQHRIHWLDIYSSADPVPTVRYLNTKKTSSRAFASGTNGRCSAITRPIKQIERAFFRRCQRTREVQVFEPADHRRYARQGSEGSQQAGELRRIRTLGYKLTRLALASALLLALFSDRFTADLGASLGSWINALCGTARRQLDFPKLAAAGVSRHRFQALRRCLWPTSSLPICSEESRGRYLRPLLFASTRLGCLPSTRGADASEILLFFFVIGFSVLSLSIHLYISEPLPITRWIVDAIPNASNYVLWQAICWAWSCFGDVCCIHVLDQEGHPLRQLRNNGVQATRC